MLYIILPGAAFNSVIRALDHSPQGAVYTWVKWTSIKAKLRRNCYHYLVLVIKHHISNSRKTRILTIPKLNLFLGSTFAAIFS